MKLKHIYYWRIASVNCENIFRIVIIIIIESRNNHFIEKELYKEKFPHCVYKDQIIIIKKDVIKCKC